MTSRTTKVIKNARVALFFYFLNLILNFISRRVFLDYLGPDILGLNTTLTNFISLLNLTELGLGGAIAYSLYTPISQNDKKTVDEIVSVEAYWYRIIVYIIAGISFIALFFFPYFFSSDEVELWAVYATFLVLLCSSLLGYLWNYRQIVLSADLKEYKITINKQGWTICKVLVQILFLSLFNGGYISWLIIELIFSIVNTISLNYLIKKEYPWLTPSVKLGKSVKNQYVSIVRKTKQLFCHKIGGFVLTQTTPLIIYSFTTLTIVAIYGNYWLILLGLTTLFNALFNGINSGVGNLVAEGNKERIRNVFWELFSIRFILATTSCFVFWKVVSLFVTLWVGKQYLLDNESVFLLLLILYIQLMRGAVDLFTNAYGLFHDVWAPICEAVINISLSIVLGYFWGLNGILCGVLISLFVIVFVWKPYFLFSNGLKISVKYYVFKYFKYLIVLALVLLFESTLITNITELVRYDNAIIQFIIYIVIYGVSFGVMLSMILFLVAPELRFFLKRFL